MLKRTATIALATVLAGALIYGGYWWLAATTLRKGLDSWAAERRADGWTVSHRAVSMGGFPAHLSLTFEGPEIGVPQIGGGWRWQGPRLVASAVPWRPDRITLSAPGHHRFRPASDPTNPVNVHAGTANGDLAPLSDQAGMSVQADLGAVVIQPIDGSPRRRIARIEMRLELPSRQDPRIDLRLSDIDFGEAPIAGRDLRIDQAHVVAALTGRLPAGAPRRALEAWRADGGTVEISRLDLRWQTLAVNGDGTLALDSELQPIAALHLDITGYRLLVDVLAGIGPIGYGEDTAIKRVLDLIAFTPSGTGGGLAVPVTIQDRRLSLGPVPVIALPQIVWR